MVLWNKDIITYQHTTYPVMCLSELFEAPMTVQKGFRQYDDSTAADVDSCADVVSDRSAGHEVSIMYTQPEVRFLVFQIGQQFLPHPVSISVTVGHEGVVVLRGNSKYVNLWFTLMGCGSHIYIYYGLRVSYIYIYIYIYIYLSRKRTNFPNFRSWDHKM